MLSKIIERSCTSKMVQLVGFDWQSYQHVRQTTNGTRIMYPEWPFSLTIYILPYIYTNHVHLIKVHQNQFSIEINEISQNPKPLQENHLEFKILFIILTCEILYYLFIYLKLLILVKKKLKDWKMINLII